MSHINTLYIKQQNLAESFISRKRDSWKFAALTAYDYPMARLLDELGLDFLLVGDSLGMVVLGHPDTTKVTPDDMVHHTRAVARGAQRTPVFVFMDTATTESE